MVTVEQEAGELIQAAVPEFSSGRWEFLSCRTVEYRRHRRKRIAVYEVSYREASDGPVTTQLMLAKLYGSDRGANGHGALVALWEAGFRPPSPHRVPRPFGYSGRSGALVQGKAPGRQWVEALGSDPGALIAACHQAAGWLVRLQSSGVPGITHPPERAVDDVRRFAEELSAAFPEHRARLAALASTLVERLDGTDGPAAVPSHGDYHPKNVFVDGEATTVIDLDTFGAREPAYDVGYAFGQLLVMSHRRMGDLGVGEGAAVTFWRRYADDGTAPWDRVAIHVGRTLMQSLHFELCTFRNGRTELLTLWPDLAERWLAAEDPAGS